MDNYLGQVAQRGASMIEILVAILVIAVGLLGVASTQTLGLANTASAMQRSYAAQFTNELADIARASARYAQNEQTVFNGFKQDTALSALTFDEEKNAIALSCVKVSSNCTAEQMASESLHLWRQRLLNALPDSTFTVVREGNGEFTLTIIWNDSRQERDELNRNVTFSTRFSL